MKCQARCGHNRRRHHRRRRTGNDPDMPCSRFSARPETERACAVQCGRDCVTTDLGPETSDCESCWNRWSARHRSVLLEPQEGGLPCQDLTEMVACPRRPRCEVQYRQSNNRYRLGRWTDCAAFHPSQAVATFGSLDRSNRDNQGSTSRGFTSVIGYRRRSVDCIDMSGTSVDKKSATWHSCFS